MENLQLVGEQSCNHVLNVGSTLTVSHIPTGGTEYVILEKEITERMHLTLVRIYKFENFDGVKSGYLVMLGEE